MNIPHLCGATTGNTQDFSSKFQIFLTIILFVAHCISHAVLHAVHMTVEHFENLRLELRRGCLILAVLAQLRTEHYGYVLRKALADLGLAIDENTLYPLLRRLESQGLLDSEWREEDKRNKRFYRLSKDGEILLYQLLNEWESLNASIDRILAPQPKSGVLVERK